MPKQDVYELIAKLCNLGPVQDLLRKYKQDVAKEKRSDILVGGDNKHEIVTKNLRRAVEKRLIPLEEVYALLQDAEENGNQHIFLYKPKSKAATALCQNGDAFATALWGNNWQKKFPKFTLKTNKYVWADFRIGLEGKPRDWVAKLYGHEEQLKFTGEEEEISDTHMVRHFELESIRTVCLVRWNNNDILEIRIPRSSSIKDAVRRRTIVWNKIEDAIDQAIFDPWPLDIARSAMLKTEKDESDVYETGDKEFIDDESCRTTFNMHASEDTPHASDTTKTAMETYVQSEDDDSYCNRLIVFWKPQNDNPLKKTIRTQLGTKDHPNELIIFAQVSSEVVDYVTNQIRRFVD